MKLRRMHIILILLCVIILVSALSLFQYMRRVTNYQENVRNFTYSDIDIQNIADGTYIGECDVDFIYAKVQVTVEKGKITDITLLEHRNERGALAEAITDTIIAKQQIDVDAISGATNSSKVIKKAIEDALQ